MECFKNVLILFAIIILNTSRTQGDALDDSVKKSNIFYQRPLKNGKSLEMTLETVDELSSKTDIKVIVHGYLGNRFHSSIAPLRNAYLAQGMDNVLLSDWESAASFDYATSRSAVAKVGAFLAKQLERFLNKHQIPLTEVHIVGHSLGAHIAGNMGYYFNGSVGRVTGLDPALPLFIPDASDSLHSNAALFVDVIHTDYPVFGDNTQRGTVDFYPNYGHVPQKGCGDVDIVTASKLVFQAYSCSHNRAVLLYAESIGLPHNFPSVPCSSIAIRKRSHSLCLHILKTNTVTKSELVEAIASKNDTIFAYMGEAVSRSSSGSFYLETFDLPPYGLGLHTQVY